LRGRKLSDWAIVRQPARESRRAVGVMAQQAQDLEPARPLEAVGSVAVVASVAGACIESLSN